MSVDPWSALRKLRIGCVKYLNSRPLICSYDGPVIFEHPSVLARMLAAGELDVALVPTFEVLRCPRYEIVDGVAVACDGPVFSVILAHHGKLRDVRSVALDPASLTSANLVRVLLAEFHHLRPEFAENGEARLIIGNQAIEFRLAQEKTGEWNVLDLGEEWKRCTGLPFVFAVWAMRPGMNKAAADALRMLRRAGLMRVPELVEMETFATVDVRRAYLTQHIQFGIDAGGRTAILKYRELLARHGLIEDATTPLKFV